MINELYKYLMSQAGNTNYFTMTAIVQEGDPLTVLIQPAQTAGDFIKLNIHQDGNMEIVS